MFHRLRAGLVFRHRLILTGHISSSSQTGQPCYFELNASPRTRSTIRSGLERRVPECATVIFGANGDLTKRKLVPALYRLAYDRRLSAGFAVVGSSTHPDRPTSSFARRCCEAVKEFSEDTPFDEDVWNAFAAGLFYVAGDINDPDLYERARAKLTEIEKRRHTGGNVLFYLSTQPSQYAAGAARPGRRRPGKGNGWRRLIVEKPFGHDLESARELNDATPRGLSTKPTSTASIIIWARKPCRTSWPSASATAFSSRCGTAAT